MISVSRNQDFSAKNHVNFKRSHEHGERSSLWKNFGFLTKEVWSPIIWRGDYRAKANFESCRYAVFDFDNGVWTIQDTIAFVRSLKLGFIIGTTKSHQIPKKSDSGHVAPPCDRFRLIMAFEREIISLSEYEYNMRMLMDLMPVDISCKDGARFFYPCTKIAIIADACPTEHGNRDGKNALPVLECPPEETLEAKRIRHEARMQKYAGCSTYPPEVRRMLKEPVAEGERHLTAYKLGAILFHFNDSVETIFEKCMQTNMADIGEEQLMRAVRNGYERAERESG